MITFHFLLLLSLITIQIQQGLVQVEEVVECMLLQTYILTQEVAQGPTTLGGELLELLMTVKW